MDVLLRNLSSIHPKAMKMFTNFTIWQITTVGDSFLLAYAISPTALQSFNTIFVTTTMAIPVFTFAGG